MSDFDEEAERERLREKYEQEEEKRQATEQMSELLLKGATMLNVHCDQCASPIFRYEGEEFCPTCQRTVEEIQQGQPTEDGASPQAQETIEEPQGGQAPEETQTPQPPAPAPAQPQEPTRVPQTNAGEALEATISRLADRAATAEDPRQAAELLEAARTAAETLAIVEGRPQSGS